jgi:uncharacterized protein YfaS (alpha-2-macroglobulin family)
VRRFGFLAVILGLAAASACSAPGPEAAKLAPVASVPNPSLPRWITSISPTRTAQSLAQIRVIFAKPVTKVEALSGDGPREVLDRVTIEPALRGHFTVLTPQMIGFVAEQALPVGTRVRVTLHTGLRDLAGDALAKDLAWSFETAPLAFSGLPSNKATDDATPAPVGLRPKIPVTANGEVDPASLAAHASLVAGADRVPLSVKLEAQPTPYPGSGAAERFDPSLKDWVYDLTPQRDLQAARTYSLEIAPGVEPAYGNVASVAHFTGAIHTYDPLAIVTTPAPSPGSGSGGRFAGGDPAIVFNNPLDPKSVAGAVSVSPAPAKVKTLTTLSDDASTIAIDPYALDPNATYSVTVAGTVKDVFGQTLGQARNLTFRTGDFAPGAWAPTGTSVIPAGLGVALNFYATNLPGNRYQAAYAKVPAQKLFNYPDPLTDLPAYAGWPQRSLPNARHNVQSVVPVSLQQQLGGPFGALAYGFRTSLDAADVSPSLTGIAQLTNLGVFGEFFPERGTVFVQHLSDGAPAGGVSVTLYRNIGGNGSVRAVPAVCATASTGSNGEAAFGGVDLERCYAGNTNGNDAPSVGVIASEGTDQAVLTLSGYSGLYRFAVSPGWTSGAPLSRGTVFSDRQMYQPGERGEITGVAYYVSGARVVADANAVYKVTLTDPSNGVKRLPDVKTDAYGIFSLPIAFSPQQALGYYTIDAKGPSGNDINGSLRVAEFKPPNFKLAVDLSAPSATAGGSVHAAASAAYLFGAPLQGGNLHAYVTREAATVQPKGWDDFWFGRQWFWPEETPSFDTDVLQKDLPLDAQGKAGLDVSVPGDLPFPMTYTVDMEATDVSNLSVADSQNFLALPSDAAIGLASDVVGTAGKPMPIRTIVTDAAGRALAGRAIHLELQKMTYTSATQEVEGGESAQQAVKYETVATADATSGDAAVPANLTPTDAGPYRVRANFAGAKSDASATDIQVFAFGPGEVDWGASDPTVVPVQLDKKTYAVGDTATALIASPFERSDVYFSVVRGDVLYRTTLRDVHGAARISFKILPGMLPNAAAQAIVVRRGPALKSLKPGALDTLTRTGVAAFDVSVADRYLKLKISPQAATVAPGGPQRVDFALTNKNGAAAKGEIVAMVVNDAILQLSGYRLPDLVATVFADQPISEMLGDSRDGIVLKTQTPPVEKGFGYGGGYLAGAAGTRVRQQFLPLAYYGVVKTDASGRASVAFKMPDDLTTWRVMAVAVGDGNAHFTTSDATFIASLPLIANPLLPQFARPGDEFDAGIALSNQTGAGGALELVMKLTGSLAFASGDPHQQTSTPQAATGTQAFRFPVKAGTPAPTTVNATAALGANRDAFSVPFAVSMQATTESMIASGVAEHVTQFIPIQIAPGARLDVTVGNSVVPQFIIPSKAMMSQDALPLADETASRLTIAAALLPLRVPYHLKLDFDPAAEAAKQLQQLVRYQRGDGGFGETARARESDPFVSAYAIDALYFARAERIGVDPGVLARGRSFAAGMLANPGRFGWCAPDPVCKARMRFEALWTLAQGGDRRTDFLTDIVARSDGFDSATKIRLARYLLQTAGWQHQGIVMAANQMQTLYSTGRFTVANLTDRWGWQGSQIEAQAQTLKLLLEIHAPKPQLDAAVRGLVTQPCRCGWDTPNDTATALTALAVYSHDQPIVPSTVVVSVGEIPIGKASFGKTAATRTFTAQGAQLKGPMIGVEATDGTVHYTAVYTYPVAADAPGQLAAFRVERRVSDPGSTAPPLATMDLAPGPPLDVPAGHVYDVGVRVIVDHPVDRLVIEDPLPAGFEAVDTTFRTSLKTLVPQSDSWEIDTQQIYRDRVVAFASHLGPGIYDVHYLVRSVTPGTFAWPGARAYLVDAPEQFGRSTAATLHVSP